MSINSDGLFCLENLEHLAMALEKEFNLSEHCVLTCEVKAMIPFQVFVKTEII